MDRRRGAVTASPQPGYVALYRFYDSHESLLYIGVSNDPRRRWKQHANEKPWYPRVRHQALTWYESEYAARKAETAAIRAERPEFNVAGAIRPARARIAIRVDHCAIVAWGWFYGAIALVAATMLVAPLNAALRDAAIAAILVMPLLCTAALIVAAAPFIRRFGAWLERNTASAPPREIRPPRPGLLEYLLVWMWVR